MGSLGVPGPPQAPLPSATGGIGKARGAWRVAVKHSKEPRRRERRAGRGKRGRPRRAQHHAGGRRV